MISLLIIVIAGAALTVLQIWTSIIGWDDYIKAMLTLGVLGVGIGLVMVIGADMGQHNKMKDENYLD